MVIFLNRCQNESEHEQAGKLRSCFIYSGRDLLPLGQILYFSILACDRPVTTVYLITSHTLCFSHWLYVCAPGFSLSVCPDFQNTHQFQNIRQRCLFLNAMCDIINNISSILGFIFSFECLTKLDTSVAGLKCKNNQTMSA